MRTIIGLFCLAIAGCGYNWGHAGRELPGGHRTVFVELFENQSKEVGLDTMFSQALIQELERSGFAIVTDKNSAELIIQGTIFSVNLQGRGSDSASFVTSDFSGATAAERTSQNFTASFFTTYIFTASANLRAVRSRDKQLIWQTSVTGRKSFQSSLLKRQGVRSSNVLYNQARKKETIKLVAQEMMSDAFDRMTEKF